VSVLPLHVRLHFLQGLARCNPAHILTLSFQPNEQRFLFREFSFGFDHLAFQSPELVNNGVSIHLENSSPRTCANQSKNARPGSERVGPFLGQKSRGGPGPLQCCVSKAMTESWLVGRRDGLDASGLTAAFRALALAHLECASRRDVREPANLSR